MIAKIISSVIAALCLAAIYAVFKSRWLYVIAPKLYLNTPISDGQIVSLSIFNAGLLAEEDVAVTLRPACEFELIATSKSTLNINGKKILVPKLSGLETITVLLLVEGKTFDPVDIESVESKSTNGRVVDSKEKATALWKNAIVSPIILFLLAAPFVIGTYVGAEMQTSVIQYFNDKLELFGPSKQLAGFKTTLRENYAIGKLSDVIKDSHLTIRVDEIVRRGDILTILISITNNTSEALMTEGYLNSSAGDRGLLDLGDSRMKAFAIAPEERKTIKFKTFLPESISVKIISGEFIFKNSSGDSLNASQVIDFN